jgi:hypothetical protein
MLNKNSGEWSIIGKTRTDDLVKIPIEADKEFILSIIRSWTVDKRSDVFCILEYVIHSRYKEKVIYNDHESAVIFYKCLRSKSVRSNLDRQGIRTSVDRLNLGRKLANFEVRNR